MTMTLDRPHRGRRSGSTSVATDPAQHLRAHFAAVRVAFTWFGVRKSLNAEQKAQAAEQFGAEGNFLSAAKKLLDNRHPSFAAVTHLRTQIIAYWKGMSLPYPEPGIRLIKQQTIEPFDEQMREYRQQLDEAVDQLQQQFSELKEAARQRLGSLFNVDDYPPTLVGLFAVEHEFVSVEPPQYLASLNPQLYRQQCNRIAARFDEAVQLAEQAFIGEFGKLVAHLSERLTVGADGQKKTFRDSAITNLNEFFERFRSLNIRSNAELDQLVESARQTLDGTDPQSVRDNDTLRQQIVTQLSSVQTSLDAMLIDQPRRRILRAAEQNLGNGGGGCAIKPQ